MKLISPSGTEIIGTFENVNAWSLIVPGSFKPNFPGGPFIGTQRFEFDHDGETIIQWHSQQTVIRKHYRVFVDVNGEEFTEDQLELVED